MTDLEKLMMQSKVDSGALSGPSVVAHRFDQAGDYVVRVLKRARPSHAVRLTVGKRARKDAAGTHLNVTRAASAEKALAKGIRASHKEYVLFKAPSDAPHAVVVHATGAAEAGDLKPDIPAETAEFDSRRLGPGDVFSTILFRPGAYVLKNKLSKAAGTIAVSYPVITPRVPYKVPGPVRIKCGRDGFRPATIKMKPAQGLVITMVDTEARITIVLESPDEGPASAAAAS